MNKVPVKTVRILIADDHPVVRDGLAAMLSTQADFQVVGEAATGRETVQKTLELQPDILLLDLQMDDLDGVQVLEQLQQSGSKAQAIIFTAFDTDERIWQALKRGARGYLLKGSPRQELFTAIRTVNRGDSLLQPPVISRLLEYIRSTNTPSNDLVEPLTDRQMEILQLVAQGKLNKEIARELNISERTVKFHVSALLRKLDAGNRTEAVSKAAEAGLIEL